MAEEDQMGERPAMDAAMDTMPPMERPPMPPMEGANMKRSSVEMPPEAVARLMQPSQEIGAVLLARIANMAPEELRMIDSAITPAVADVLMKLLPELQQIISQVGGQRQEAPVQTEMGALSGM
tara:strand:+ start:2893 stop:3261 length:369 start_codon:yes stop_codon:yes gene_type:complete